MERIQRQVDELIHRFNGFFTHIKETFQDVYTRLQRLEEAVLILQKRDETITRSLKTQRRAINEMSND